MGQTDGDAAALIATASDSDSIEVLRARYAALKAAGQGEVTLPPKTTAATARDIGNARVRERIPGGWYTTLRISRGEGLRIVNLTGSSAVTMMFWNAADTSERFNSADTVKVQWTAAIEGGRLLLTDMGRAGAAIVEDSTGAHDALLGGSTQESVAARFGAERQIRNTRDNLVYAVGKLGLDRRDLAPPMTFFAPVGVDSEGRFGWKPGKVAAGDFVTLRAEMDLLVALSNCRHPLDPAEDPAPGPIEIAVFRLPEAGADDPARTLTAEARRAYENSDAYLAGR